VRKAKKNSAGTPALKKRHRRSFWGVLPISPGSRTEKHNRHRGKTPEVSLHSAPAHEIFGSRTSLLHTKKIKCIFSKGVSYSGLNTRYGLATRACQENRAQGRFGFAH
jgi:hypothetical protein